MAKAGFGALCSQWPPSRGKDVSFIDTIDGHSKALWARRRETEVGEGGKPLRKSERFQLHVACNQVSSLPKLWSTTNWVKDWMMSYVNGGFLNSLFFGKRFLSHPKHLNSPSGTRQHYPGFPRASRIGVTDLTLLLTHYSICCGLPIATSPGSFVPWMHWKRAAWTRSGIVKSPFPTFIMSLPAPAELSSLGRLPSSDSRPAHLF